MQCDYISSGRSSRLGDGATTWLATLVLCLAVSSIAEARQYTLQWDANTDSVTAGYRVYQNATGVCDPAGGTDVGTATQFTGLNLTLHVTYHFFVCAYDDLDQFGPPSAILTFTPGRKINSDFNGDGRSDPGIFRPGSALWYSPSGSGAAFQIFFGAPGDIPVPGDYDGDRLVDAVIWRPSSGLWYGPRTGAATIVVQLLMGQSGDIPVPCDYDGDGAMDPAFYRPSTGLWFGTRANGATVVLNTNLGVAAGQIAVPADYNGDGRCDPGIMIPGVGPGATNLWYSVPSGGGSVFQIYFGANGDVPVPGDYDGDGVADAVIFRPTTGLWYGPRTGAAQIVTQIILGQNGDIPVPGDYDGNGAMDPAIYRPTTGLFFGTNAAGTAFVINVNLGVVAGDIPTGQRPHYQGVYPF